MVFRQLFDPQSSTYTYLLGDEETREAVAIDPVKERFEDLTRALDELALLLSWTLETHVHADHVTASGLLREQTGAKIAVHHRVSKYADLSLRDRDKLSVGNIQIEVIETPGHTPDSLSYLVNGRMVFTGDALLIGTCGRTDFQGGDPGTLYDSLHQRLFTLDADVVVYPGHDYLGKTHSTIGTEKRENSRAAGRTRAEFIDLMNNLNLPRPKKIDLAVPANLRCGLEQSE